MAKDKETGLSDLEKRFAEEYIVDLNAGGASRRAGYKMKNAANHQKNGYIVLQRPHVADYIAVLKQAQSKRLQITADTVLQEIAKVAFANIKHLEDEEGNPIPLHKLPDEVAASLAEVKTKTIEANDQAAVIERTYKALDKLAALDKLGRHLKLFTEKVETEVTHKGSLADLLARAADGDDE
ncbi:terminase small subunit [Hahella ganghwensis]|uniref:terminase small subunit n=1 Tax=Hahella ganghwensis TaxID=286420 RepID=UPI000376B3CB|nr:terminase small subunit [Hahella ganghwensis]